LRRIEIDILDKDYLDFLSICIEEELSVEDKLKNIIRYHLITYRNRKKIRNQKLF
jgi:hypothetical protein